MSKKKLFEGLQQYWSEGELAVNEEVIWGGVPRVNREVVLVNLHLVCCVGTADTLLIPREFTSRTVH